MIDEWKEDQEKNNTNHSPLDCLKRTHSIPLSKISHIQALTIHINMASESFFAYNKKYRITNGYDGGIDEKQSEKVWETWKNNNRSSSCIRDIVSDPHAYS